MKAGRASRTAELMALFRAMESCRPQGRLFEDPFAPLFLRPPLRLLYRLSRVPVLRSLVEHSIDAVVPGARSSGIARTRFIDDQLRSALDNGCRQVVIAGAGFDCRAYRVRGIERTSVFEVDHPQTLMEKQRRLSTVLSPPPPHVRFVETDFNERDLAEAMARSGYVARRLTCFIWEGVTNYLTGPAIDATFRWFAAAAPGSLVVFTYVHARMLAEPEAFYGAAPLLRRLRRMDEPWTFGFDPVELAPYLAARRLRLVEDLGANEYRGRYGPDRTDGRGGYEFYRVAVARLP